MSCVTLGFFYAIRCTSHRHSPARSDLSRDPVQSIKDRTNSSTDVHSWVQHSSSASEGGKLTSRMNYTETTHGIYIFSQIHISLDQERKSWCHSSLTTQPGWVHKCSSCLLKVTYARNSIGHTAKYRWKWIVSRAYDPPTHSHWSRLWQKRVVGHSAGEVILGPPNWNISDLSPLMTAHVQETGSVSGWIRFSIPFLRNHK